jgi:type I restriction enzyme, R subunit
MGPPSAYSEESIVEEPAVALFAQMGWRTASAMEEKFGSVFTQAL